MRNAIEKAIYYSNTVPSYLEESEIIFYYDAKDIKNLCNNYILSIDAKSIFGDENSISYNIIKTLPDCYNKLLLSQLDSILIVDKFDRSIRLINKDISDQIHKIAIIRIDSVKSSIKESWSKWWLLPLAGLTAGGVYWFRE